MKLFDVKSFEEISYELHYGNEVKIETEKEYKVVLVQETIEYLMNHNRGGSTVRRIRQLIASLYNFNHYPAPPDLFGMLRNADNEHHELIVNIVEFMGLKYGEACFMLINDFAPKMINEFIEELHEVERKSF